MWDLRNIANTPIGLVTLAPPFRYDQGNEVVKSELLIRTENAVFIEDGRYYVAGEHSDSSLGWGIFEVVKAASDYQLRQIVPGYLEVESAPYPCWFHGLTTDGNYLYATAAVHLPSEPEAVTPMYVPLNPNNVLDDLTILPNGRIAVGEVDFLVNFNGVEGWGINQIVTVDPNGGLLNKHATLTSPYTVSSLVYSEGALFTAGKLVATSWFHGGIREIELS